MASTRLHFDVVVTGGGPAGIAAAVTAAKSRATVALLDDNPAVGGQIWRGEARASGNADSASWFQQLRHSPVQVIAGAQVFEIGGSRVAAETDRGLLDVRYRELILATGARELFLPFPGWTLPNVFGAGGLQALMKTGLPVRGKRIVVAGTGPLLFAVASYARKHGAKVLAICEQTSLGNMLRFVWATTRAGKLSDALRFRLELPGVTHWRNCWPIAALGSERLEHVRVSHNGQIRELECDYLACGFHLVPNLELPKYAGCAIVNGFVQVDEFQRSSQPHIYCAGEPTGIGGLEMALVEGQIAGHAATRNENAARRLFAERARYARFEAELKNAFALRQELKFLAEPDTLLCRCEDVPFERVQQFRSWRAAKLHTRCGMGPCQGRVCGAAAEVLFGWNTDSIRPPVFAVQCANLAAVSATADLKGTKLNGGSQ